MHCPYKEHLAFQLLVKSNPGKCLLFKGDSRSIEAFVDAEWASTITYRKSTSGYNTYVMEKFGDLEKQKNKCVVARSSVEVEYMAMANGVCEILWIRRALKELKLKVSLPMKLLVLHIISYNTT